MEPHTLNDAELDERFSHASGPGGQNVNKVATRVTLTHLPTGLTVSVQDTRSQSENRRIARERLVELLAQREREQRQAVVDRREKERRRKRPRPAAVKRAIRENKRRRSEVKRGRARPSED